MIKFYNTSFWFYIDQYLWIITDEGFLQLKFVDLIQEYTVRTKIKFLSPEDMQHVSKCTNSTNKDAKMKLSFRIQRDDSSHSSIIAYRRLDTNEDGYFKFTGGYADHTNVVYDGENLTCTGLYNNVNAIQCNELPINQSVPATIYEIDFNPRSGSAYQNQWTRNEYTIETNYYEKVKACTGK